MLLSLLLLPALLPAAQIKATTQQQAGRQQHQHSQQFRSCRHNIVTDCTHSFVAAACVSSTLDAAAAAAAAAKKKSRTGDYAEVEVVASSHSLVLMASVVLVVGPTAAGKSELLRGKCQPLLLHANQHKVRSLNLTECCPFVRWCCSVLLLQD